MRNFTLKLVSLLCGLCLFLFVNYFFSSNDEGTRVVQLIAPVEVRNVPVNKALIWPSSKQVEITIQGSALFMSKVTLSPPVVKVNLPEFVGDRYVAKLSADDVSLPATVRLLAIKPAELEFALDDIVEKRIKIVVPQIGNLTEELKLSSLEIEPIEVGISGPSRELKSVNQIETVPLNLSQIKASTQLDLELRNPGILSELEFKRTKIKLNIEDSLGELNFQNLPVKLVFSDDIAESDIAKEYLNNEANKNKTVNLKIIAAKRILKEIKAEDLNPYLQIDKLEQLDQAIELRLETEQDVKSVHFLPDKIQLKNDIPKKSTVKLNNSKDKK